MPVGEFFHTSGTSDTIFIVLGVALLVANAVGFLRMLALSQLCARARSILRTCAEAFRPRKEAEGDGDEVDLMVQVMAQQVTLDRFRLVCNTLCAVRFAVTAGMLLNTARQQAGRVSFMTEVVNVIEHGIFTTLVLRPGLLSWKTIDLFYAAFVLVTALYFVPGVFEPDRLVWRLGVANLEVAGLLVGRTKGRAVVPLNLLYVIVTLLAILAAPQALPVSPVLPIMVQLMLALAVLPCAHILELGMEAAIRQGLEVNATKELLAAVSAVLRSCCDVVVELDSEGSVTSPALDLGVFLLRRRGCSLQGTHFADLLTDDEEKSIFLKKLHMPKATDLGVAEALHVRMRDADSSVLQVELFACPFRHLSGQARNLVGVRESEDEREPSVASTHSNRSAQSSRSALSRSGDNRHDPWAAMLIVDTTSDRLSIHGCSPGFQLSVGRLAPGLGLLDIVKEAEDFAKWMKMAATYGADWPKSRVTLNLRQGCVRVTVGVAHEEEDGSVDRKHVQLLFSNMAKSKVHSDGCTHFKPHTNYRGTPVLHMML